jgi:hypothetical protein
VLLVLFLDLTTGKSTFRSSQRLFEDMGVFQILLYGDVIVIMIPVLVI